jgi:hypothetical protein
LRGPHYLEPERLYVWAVLSWFATIHTFCSHRADHQPAQIRIHRAFIPSPGNQLSSVRRIDVPLRPLTYIPSRQTTFPSLAICANAARSCAHVLDVQCKRTASPLYNPQMIVRSTMVAKLSLIMRAGGTRRLSFHPLAECIFTPFAAIH